MSEFENHHFSDGMFARSIKKSGTPKERQERKTKDVVIKKQELGRKHHEEASELRERKELETCNENLVALADFDEFFKECNLMIANIARVHQWYTQDREDPKKLKEHEQFLENYLQELLDKLRLVFDFKDLPDEQRNAHLEKDLSERLPKYAKKYFDHDAKPLQKGCIMMAKPFIFDDIKEVVDKLKLSIQEGQSFDIEKEIDIDKVSQRWDRIMKYWQAYKFVLEDIYLRGAKNGSVIKKDIDNKSSINRMVGILRWMMGKGDEGQNLPNNETYHRSTDKYVNKKNIVLTNLSEDELRFLRINVPHGIIFNLLRNCLHNATANEVHKIDDTSLELEFDREGNELIFYFRDNGKGAKPKVMEKMFKEGKSFRGSTGLGLAGADERLKNCGGKVEVSSLDQTQKTGFNTTFKITVKII